MATIAILPAHDEAATIADAIAAVLPQVDRVIVACDNCSDQTYAIAQAAGAEPFNTVNNTARKAGALNQALALIAPTLGAGDYVLCQDADTILTPTWVRDALTALNNPQHPADAAGAVFRADTDKGWLHGCQAFEWARYEEELGRTGKTFVLSGTAALIRWEAFEGVRETYGHYYNTAAICEDFQLTIDLKRTGAVLTSPPSLTVTTETMPTVADLFRQRRRWSLGAMQVCARSGTSPVMHVYWRQQAMIAVGIVCLWTYFAITVYGVATFGFHLSPFWFAIGCIFAGERVATVWDAGPRARIIAALIIPELAYAVILQAAHVAALYQFATRSTGTWSHVAAH